MAADGSSLTGREAIAGALRSLIDSGASFAIELGALFIAGDVAVATGKLTLASPDDPTQQLRSHATVVYRRDRRGRWLIAIDAPWGLPTLE